MEAPGKSLQIALALPTNFLTTIHVHLTFFKTNTLVFLTTTATEDSGELTPMGSFVYAMPNRLEHEDVLSTTLYSSDDTVDHAIRMARILTRRMNIPVYVGSSMKFSDLIVEEEMESLTQLTKAIMDQWNQHLRS